MTESNSSLHQILLHNDDFNSMEYVVETLLATVDGMTEPQAVNAMMEAHHHNTGLITTCTLEQAESYFKMLSERGLICTLKPLKIIND